MRILVVEDELTSRELLKVILEPYGQIDTVSDGVEAIKAYTLGMDRRRQGSDLEALPFFERAVEIDPHFATAYFALSTVYGNLGESDKAREFGQRAFTERQYVSERAYMMLKPNRILPRKLTGLKKSRSIGVPNG